MLKKTSGKAVFLETLQAAKTFQRLLGFCENG